MKWSTCLQVWVNLSLLLIHKYSDFKFELFGAIKSILAVKECSAQAWRQPVTLDYNLIKQPRPSVVRLLSSPTPALLFYLSLFLKNNYSHSSWQRNTHPPGSCRVAAGREGGREGERAPGGVLLSEVLQTCVRLTGTYLLDCKACVFLLCSAAFCTRLFHMKGRDLCDWNMMRWGESKLGRKPREKLASYLFPWLFIEELAPLISIGCFHT